MNRIAPFLVAQIADQYLPRINPVVRIRISPLFTKRTWMVGRP